MRLLKSNNESVIVMTDCHETLESYIGNILLKKSLEQQRKIVVEILFQLKYITERMYQDLKLIHKDIHFKNIMIEKLKDEEDCYMTPRFRNTTNMPRSFHIQFVRLRIIDFGFSEP